MAHPALFRLSAALLLLLSTAACPGCPPGNLVGPTDGGSADAGRLSNDGGSTDGGRLRDGGPVVDGGQDGGNLDAGAPDAGADAGTDAGEFDAGEADAGTLDGGGNDAGVLDAGPAFDAGPPGALCASDADCAPNVCRFVVNAAEDGLEGRCVSPIPSGRSRGDGCAEGSACASGLCVNFLCAGPCEVDNACGLNQVCGSRVIVVDEVAAPVDVCLRATLPDVQCEDDSDCAATGRICRNLEPTDGGSALFCDHPTAGEGEIGASCSGNFLEEIAFCRTGLCDDADEGEGACTAACNDDDDCASAGPGWTCTASGVGGFDGRLCGQECVRQSDCGAGRSCTRRQDVVDNRSEFICDGHRGAGVAGDVVTTGSECQTGLARIDGATSERYCTEVCVDDDDCAGALTCSAVSTTFPDGTGVQELLLCGR